MTTRPGAMTAPESDALAAHPPKPTKSRATRTRPNTTRRWKSRSDVSAAGCRLVGIKDARKATSPALARNDGSLPPFLLVLRDVRRDRCLARRVAMFRIHCDLQDIIAGAEGLQLSSLHDSDEIDCRQNPRPVGNDNDNATARAHPSDGL